MPPHPPPHHQVRNHSRYPTNHHVSLTHSFLSAKPCVCVFVRAYATATRVDSGLQGFRVETGPLGRQEALEEVATRIEAYCATFESPRLVCQRQGATVLVIVARTEDSSSPTAVGGNELARRLGDDWEMPSPTPHRFRMDVELEWQLLDKQPTSHVVRVRLDCFQHTHDAIQDIDAVRSRIEGEVCRTNRRWRRLLSSKSKSGVASAKE